MKTKILTVLEQIWTNMRSPIDVRTTVQEARPGGLLLPHITWVVLSMFHYLSRTRWAWTIIQGRLFHTMAASWTPEVAGRGVLELPTGEMPLMPAWRYEVFTGASNLTNIVTGERIDIDTDLGPHYVNTGRVLDYFEARHRPETGDRTVRA
ncbi:MAG: hypothetical protein ACLQNE_31830 [Thermoguttaceae bacterium]